ncbi:helix-turn-helix domain-containing protein [Actinacidiphila oryziradicis]|uniref:Helix-turn-helix domain-containing protein n=1 Tax=Actinacidiphila oryziradicis TaxID=2571141 RepID=A0A4U0RV57_9ACTN|nr:helix-turn-helix transcriptional regulator [Actinacidiphila oryziradicis]TJZ99376.1 helix-turn-helix domain-containing protein [Actinacidiphila oryziradicis]
MPAGGRPTVRSRRLGAALKAMRLAAGFDQATAAEAIVGSVTKVSRMETGHVNANPLAVRVLLDLYGVQDQVERSRLEQLARESSKRGWWVDYADTVGSTYAQYISMEQDATYIRTWETVLMPGLLQTPEYVLELLESNPTIVPPDRAQAFVKVRQERQARIEEAGARFAAIIWEPAITASISSPETRRAQLSRLLDVGKRQNVTVQVLPLSARAATASGPFVGFSFSPELAIEAVTVESATGTMVVESQEEITRYVFAFDALAAAALGPDASAAFIRGVRDTI